jgi:hypothetical protein
MARDLWDIPYNNAVRALNYITSNDRMENNELERKLIKAVVA